MTSISSKYVGFKILSKTETSESTKDGFNIVPIAGFLNLLLASAAEPGKTSLCVTSAGVVS